MTSNPEPASNTTPKRPRKIDLWSWRKTDLYFDFRDWWIGYYRADGYHYFCPIPTLVIRRIREIKGRPYPPGMGDNPYGTEGW